MDTPRSPQLIDTVQAGLNLGLTLTGVGNKAGISRATVQRMLAEGVVTDATRPPIPKCRHLRIPRWVPGDLRADYFDNRRLYGEIHAARLARVAKAEAARPEI